eukprot:2206929-Pyramimonas_sp.AAC.1
MPDAPTSNCHQPCATSITRSSFSPSPPPSRLLIPPLPSPSAPVLHHPPIACEICRRCRRWQFEMDASSIPARLLKCR